MNLHKIDRKALLVWWIRLCLGALVLSFLSALFFAPHSIWWVGATALWVVAFLVLFVWYYPLKYHKLSYAANSEILVINCGVIYTRRKSMLIKNIQYISIVSMPLLSAFGLRAVFFHAAGGFVYLPCVRLGDALLLQELLTPQKKKEGGA